MGLYRRIASLIPISVINAYKRELKYVGLQVSEKRFTGFIALFGFGIAIAVAVNLFIFLKVNPLVSFLLTFIAFAGGIYFWLSRVADAEGKIAERVLPDVLELVASNVKAGLTTERALFASARPEFGVVSEELKNASKEIMSGRRMEDALMEMPTKIKSKALERSIWLLVQGIKSGGEIANLLIQLGSDFREENVMKDEIAANISMYKILIFAAAILGAPLLFGISSLIVGTLIEQTANIGITPEEIASYSSMSSMGRFIGVPTVNITESFIVVYSALAIAITGIFASLTTGAMSAGSEKEGVKYIPIVLVISLAIFFAIRIFLGGMLGGVAGMLA